LKNIIIIALSAYIAAPFAHYVIDPEPIARSCPYDKATAVCYIAAKLWIERDGVDYVTRKLFADRLDYRRLDQELDI
jgi:hypothetical protein